MKFIRFRLCSSGGALAAAIMLAGGARPAEAQPKLDALRSEARDLQYKVIGRPCTKTPPIECMQPEAGQLERCCASISPGS
jgi:hypothetical protein